MNVATFSALAEPNRLDILHLLSDGPLPVGEIADRLDLNQPQTSKHLRVLHHRPRRGAAAGEQTNLQAASGALRGDRHVAEDLPTYVGRQIRQPRRISSKAAGTTGTTQIQMNRRLYDGTSTSSK